ncbi:MAG: ATP-binding cassette domain-containing protein, partial [Planctomycetota bacterium]|nr:ATP-binding cassette domain-containing protein [Planctomycetota bacterium]
MLKVDSLTKSFSLETESIRAVDQLSFTVEASEVFGLLGPNGAGKTTTLRMILGLLVPDEGFAEVLGRRTSEDPDAVKQRLGFVSASDGVYPWLSVREMLLYFGDLYGV